MKIPHPPANQDLPDVVFHTIQYNTIQCQPRRANQILNNAGMQQQLAQIQQNQHQTAAGRRIVGIMTTNTITTTYNNRQQPTVTCYSTSVWN